MLLPYREMDICTPPIDGDRLIAIRQDQAILHYKPLSL